MFRNKRSQMGMRKIVTLVIVLIVVASVGLFLGPAIKDGVDGLNSGMDSKIQSMKIKNSDSDSSSTLVAKASVKEIFEEFKEIVKSDAYSACTYYFEGFQEFGDDARIEISDVDGKRVVDLFYNNQLIDDFETDKEFYHQTVKINNLKTKNNPVPLFDVINLKAEKMGEHMQITKDRLNSDLLSYFSVEEIEKSKGKVMSREFFHNLPLFIEDDGVTFILKNNERTSSVSDLLFLEEKSDSDVFLDTCKKSHDNHLMGLMDFLPIKDVERGEVDTGRESASIDEFTCSFIKNQHYCEAVNDGFIDGDGKCYWLQDECRGISACEDINFLADMTLTEKESFCEDFSPVSMVDGNGRCIWTEGKCFTMPDEVQQFAMQLKEILNLKLEGEPFTDSTTSSVPGSGVSDSLIGEKIRDKLDQMKNGDKCLFAYKAFPELPDDWRIYVDNHAHDIKIERETDEGWVTIEEIDEDISGYFDTLYLTSDKYVQTKDNIYYFSKGFGGNKVEPVGDDGDSKKIGNYITGNHVDLGKIGSFFMLKKTPDNQEIILIPELSQLNQFEQIGHIPFCFPEQLELEEIEFYWSACKFLGENTCNQDSENIRCNWDSEEEKCFSPDINN